MATENFGFGKLMNRIDNQVAPSTRMMSTVQPPMSMRKAEGLLNRKSGGIRAAERPYKLLPLVAMTLTLYRISRLKKEIRCRSVPLIWLIRQI